MSKLSIHSQTEARDLVATLSSLGLKYIKVIDPSPDYAYWLTSLGIRLIVRHNFPVWSGYLDAMAFVSSCRSQGWFPHAWAIETTNEPFAGFQSVPDWFIQSETHVAQIFADHHKHTIVCNRGVGHDGYYVPPTIPPICPDDSLPYRLFGSHSYWWEPDISVTNPWYALRHEQWFLRDVLSVDPTARLFITEFGMTQAVVRGLPDVGWRTSAYTYKQIWGQVQEFADRLELTPYVESAFFFQFGGFSDWSTFEGLGTELEGLLIELYQQSHQDQQLQPNNHTKEISMPTLPMYPPRVYRFKNYQPITQRFGEDYLNPDGSPKYLLNYLEVGGSIIQANLHWGVDHGMRMEDGYHIPIAGEQVLADIPGTIYRAGERSPGDPRGIHIIIDHPDKVHYSLVAHLDSVLVAVGDEVQPGQPIGIVGNTGLSDAPHAHDAFGAFIGGVTYWRDPQLTMIMPKQSTYLPISPQVIADYDLAVIQIKSVLEKFSLRLRVE